jgi:hypothetical protein
MRLPARLGFPVYVLALLATLSATGCRSQTDCGAFCAPDYDACIARLPVGDDDDSAGDDDDSAGDDDDSAGDDDDSGAPLSMEDCELARSECWTMCYVTNHPA